MHAASPFGSQLLQSWLQINYKYIPQELEIARRITTEHQTLQIQIMPNNPGMAAAARKNVFVTGAGSGFFSAHLRVNCEENITRRRCETESVNLHAQVKCPAPQTVTLAITSANTSALCQCVVVLSSRSRPHAFSAVNGSNLCK